MGKIPDLSGHLYRLSGGLGTTEIKTMMKDQRTTNAFGQTPTIGAPISFWEFDGNPSHGLIPTTVAVPTNTTQGGIKQTDPSAGRQKWLTHLMINSNIVGTFTLYDRLLHIGNLSGTVTTAQTVGGTLTRYTDGLGNEIFSEVLAVTAIGTSSTTVTAAYTDQAGNSQTTVAAPIGGTGFRLPQRMFELPLAAGSNGVRGVTSMTLAATTGTAGNLSCVIAHPLATIQVTTACCGAVISFLDNPIEIKTGACLAFYYKGTSTTVPFLRAQLTMVEA